MKANTTWDGCCVVFLGVDRGKKKGQTGKLGRGAGGRWARKLVMGLGTVCVLKLADRRVNFFGGVSTRLLAYFILFFWFCTTESFFFFWSSLSLLIYFRSLISYLSVLSWCIVANFMRLQVGQFD